VDYEEYEEVESPYSAKPKTQAAPKERLRTRKNVFNRPFAAGSTVAPAVFETTSTRRSIGQPDNSELIHHRSSELSSTEIDYLDEEEDEEIEKRPVRTTPKKATKTKKNLLPKLAWSVIGLLVLRLICMDRGVWDYFATERSIKEKNAELTAVQTENKTLKTEITRIQGDKGYQRQLAKEHLGVIATDEFLILFAGETDADETSSAPDTNI
jgi:cell division protein FtsB